MLDLCSELRISVNELLSGEMIKMNNYNEKAEQKLLIVIGIIPFIIGVSFAIRIEQVAGYYECQKCHHKYIPTYSSVLWSMYINRTRYMKCPKCNEKSWNKKIISK